VIAVYFTLICGILFIIIMFVLGASLMVSAIGVAFALVASGLRWIYEIFLEITGRARVPGEVPSGGSPPKEVPVKEEEYTYRTVGSKAVERFISNEYHMR
jgi:hypothetical protein